MRLLWGKWKWYEQNMESWAVTSTLTTLTQLRDRAMDLRRVDEYKRYNLLIEIAQKELLEAKKAGRL